ncbi:MAG: hypothetical protein AB7O62_00420 [Pirellulales bacterium]
MPEPYDLSPRFLRTSPPVTVRVRQLWSDEWQEDPYLFCNQLIFECNPGLGAAVFEYRYGVGKRRDTATAEPWYARGLENWFVQVVVATDPAIVWTGVIVGESDQRDGVVRRGGAAEPIPSGQQRLTAVGLAYLLDREPITRAYVRAAPAGDADRLGSDDETGTDVTEIPRGISWNLGRGRPGDQEYRPNRDHEPAEFDDFNCSVFSRQLDDKRQVTDGAEFWSAAEIIDYALQGLAPAGPPDEAGNRVFLLKAWLLDDGQESTVAHLRTWQPPVVAHGRSLKEILDELNNRRRLAGYRIVVNGDDEAVLVPFTFTDEEITLGDDSTIEANPRQFTINLDDLADASFTVTRQAGSVCRQVIAQGEYRAAVVNLSGRNPEDQDEQHGGLVQDWTDDQAEAYRTAASAAGDYPAENYARLTRNREIRLADKLKRVYSYLRLPAGWAGFSRNGITDELAFPQIKPDGTVSETASIAIWPPGLRISRFLPFRESLDYSSNNILSGLVTSDLADNAAAQPEWRPLLALVQVEGRWRHLDHHAADADLAGGFFHYFSVRPQDDAPGLVVTSSNAPAHILAGDDWENIDSSDELLGEPDPDISWQHLLFVVRMECDERAEVRYPADADLGTATAHLPTMYVPVDNCFLDWVPANSIIDIRAGGLLRTGAGAFVRDDRPRLERAARLAFFWYGQPRQAISFSLQRIDPQFQIGDLITSLESVSGSEPVQAVITQVTYDLLANRTTVRTDFGELDQAALARRAA